MIQKHYSMSAFPGGEGPYEKCWEKGAWSLSDAELLSVILRTGSQGENALELSGRLLQEVFHQSLGGLYGVSVQELIRVRGIGRVKAVQLQCVAELSKRIAKTQVGKDLCFSDSHTVAAYYMEDYRHEQQEKVLLLMLDTKGRLLAEKVMTIGTVNASLVSPREIFLTALRSGAVSIILLHNHPSGDPTPSREDIDLSARIGELGRMLGIELLDHIIIGDRQAVSLRDEHLL